MESNILKVLNTINKVYSEISKDYNSNAKVEVYTNIFTRLNSVPAILEYENYAEYHWDNNKIYLYADNLENEEDVIRSLIHECVHSSQCYEVYVAYYEECGLDYDTHPYEIEAEYEEEKWRNYETKY